MPRLEAKMIETIEIVVAKTTQLCVVTQQELVEVTATAATLGTSSSSLVANVEAKSVRQMPMNDFTHMVKLAPGSTYGILNNPNILCFC